MQSALHMNGALLAAAEGVGVSTMEHCLQLQNTRFQGGLVGVGAGLGVVPS